MKNEFIFGLTYPAGSMEKDVTSIQLWDVSTEVAFENTFKMHFKGLHAYACAILKDEATAEEMVQNVFYKLWEKRSDVQINQSAAAYLYRSVYNESMNHLKHLKVRNAYQAYAVKNTSDVHNTTEKIELKDLQAKLDIALSELPEQCRTVFQLSRFEELKYMEIATRLNISVKTVEHHMGKALRLLRAKLADFLPVLLILLFNA